MRILTYVFETALRFSEPVADHSFVLRCLPKSTNTQKVMESQLFTFPRLTLSEQVDGFGNRIVSGYCPQRHKSFDFYATGQAMVSNELAGPTPAHPVFLQPSALTVPDDALRALAREVLGERGEGKRGAAPAAGVSRETGGMGNASGATDVAGAPTDAGDSARGAWEDAVALMAAVHAQFAYEPGATSTATTAAAALALGRGVCQDYAHVLIALCRCAGIPARYVTGLMVGEGATHAWVEVHDGVRWRGADPTHDRAVDDRYLLFATGRDFGDCPIERGVFRGSAAQTQAVSASLTDNESDAAPALGLVRALG